MAGAVAAAGVLMTQTFQNIQVNEALRANCATLTPSEDPVVANTSGIQTFDCGTSAAFAALIAGDYIPDFSLAGTDYNKLWIYPSVNAPAASCSAILGAQEILPAAPETLSATAYNYCAEYAIATPPDLGTFSISWSA